MIFSTITKKRIVSFLFALTTPLTTMSYGPDLERPLEKASETAQNMLPIILAITMVYGLAIVANLAQASSSLAQIAQIAAAQFSAVDQTFFPEAAAGNMRFADVAGAREAKEELQEVLEFLKRPEKFTRLGAQIPRGVLLTGEAGNGKTLLAKAVAGETGRPFFHVSGSSFIEKYIGVGAQRVRELFAQARKHAPSLIFIDEIDAIGGTRSSDTGDGSTSEYTQTLNQLLTEMDGFATDHSAVIVIAATNRPDMLDKALVRPGRFDRHIQIPYPTLQEREEILTVHLKRVLCDPAVDTARLARATVGFSGASLAALVNEAAIQAARRNKQAVELSDFDEARDKIMMGKEMRSIKMSPEELKMTAYHEAGHALVLLMLPEDTDPLYKLTIVPRGQTLGTTHFMPEVDKHSTSKPEMLAAIAMTLGGRAAEELVFDKVSSGASNDFEHATKKAHTMVRLFGMSDKLGQVTYDRNYSDATGRLIDQEVKYIIDTQYKRALAILRDNRNKLELLAQTLLEKETLYADEVYALLGITPRACNRI